MFHPVYHYSVDLLQTIEPESFVTHPILFGDFMKIGAEKNDRVYEELNNLDKLKQVLVDVSNEGTTPNLYSQLFRGGNHQ